MPRRRHRLQSPVVRQPQALAGAGRGARVAGRGRELGAGQAVFDTESLNLGDWLLATSIAASVLLLDEARKLAVHCWRMIGDRKALHGVAADR